MSQINVTRVLTNPRLLDSFVLIRRVQVVGKNGRASWTTENIPFKGVVYPEGGNKVDRRPEAQSAQKSVTIISRQSTHTAAKGFQPDILMWKGDKYEAISTEDYTHAAKGFTKSYFVVRSTTPLAPVQK
jgi:hypothetical protein